MSISYGSGGGFSGETTEYILKGNGDWKKVSLLMKDTQTLKKHPFKEIRKIFTLAASDELGDVKLLEYANMSRFIKVYKKGELYREFVWPEGKTDLPAKVAELNTMLTGLQP